MMCNQCLGITVVLHTLSQQYLCYKGEAGVVYRGYLDSGGGRNMVAIKTCKGTKYLLDHLHFVYGAYVS